MFEKICRDCVHRKSSVLCKAVSPKCRDLLGSAYGHAQRAEKISLLKLLNFLSQKSFHARLGNSADLCSSFRKIFGRNNAHICDYILDTGAYASDRHVVSLDKENSEVDLSLPSVNKRLLHVHGKTNMNDGDIFGTAGIHMYNFHLSHLSRKTSLTRESHRGAAGQEFCGSTFSRSYTIYGPRWKAKLSAFRKALIEAA